MMKLITGEHPPIYQKPHRIPLIHEKVDKHIEDTYVEAGSYYSQLKSMQLHWLFVKKNYGSLRLWVDHRPLNAITIKYNHPLPLIDATVILLHGTQHFTSLDSKSGYW